MALTVVLRISKVFHGQSRQKYNFQTFLKDASPKKVMIRKPIRLLPIHPGTPRSHLRLHHGFTMDLQRIETVAFRRPNRESQKGHQFIELS